MTTQNEQLVSPETRKKVPELKPEDLARIENEMPMQEKDFRMLDETYNEHVMALTIARGYGHHPQTDQLPLPLAEAHAPAEDPGLVDAMTPFSTMN